jgi:hypothetical protein
VLPLVTTAPQDIVRTPAFLPRATDWRERSTFVVKPRKSISMLFAVLLIALAVVARAADVRMEPSVNTFSSTKWLKEKASIENDVIQTTFALKHNKAALADFERTLLDISNPKSANYGKWLSVCYALFRRSDFALLDLNLSTRLARRDQGSHRPCCCQHQDRG